MRKSGKGKNVSKARSRHDKRRIIEPLIDEDILSEKQDDSPVDEPEDLKEDDERFFSKGYLEQEEDIEDPFIFPVAIRPVTRVIWLWDATELKISWLQPPSSVLDIGVDRYFLLRGYERLRVYLERILSEIRNKWKLKESICKRVGINLHPDSLWWYLEIFPRKLFNVLFSLREEKEYELRRSNLERYFIVDGMATSVPFSIWRFVSSQGRGNLPHRLALRWLLIFLHERSYSLESICENGRNRAKEEFMEYYEECLGSFERILKKSVPNLKDISLSPKKVEFESFYKRRFSVILDLLKSLTS